MTVRTSKARFSNLLTAEMQKSKVICHCKQCKGDLVPPSTRKRHYEKKLRKQIRSSQMKVASTESEVRRNVEDNRELAEVSDHRHGFQPCNMSRLTNYAGYCTCAQTVPSTRTHEEPNTGIRQAFSQVFAVGQRCASFLPGRVPFFGIFTGKFASQHGSSATLRSNTADETTFGGTNANTSTESDGDNGKLKVWDAGSWSSRSCVWPRPWGPADLFLPAVSVLLF